MVENNLTAESLVSEFLKRLGDKDADGIAELFAGEIDWYVPGNSALPWVGPRSKKEEVASYFNTMWPHFMEGKSQALLNKVIIKENDVILLATFTHTVESTTRVFDTPVAMHLIITDGKIASLHLYEDTWKVSDAFFPV